jgi:predicted transcriptional regulator
MKKDPFLLVSLEESESKALAQVISNDTARKILDLLSKEESATETDIGKKLKVPLSTVHYNLQALVKANLVQAEEFHYSEKGKEVLHYSLANKLIIIAPKNTRTESFKEKLKGLLPVGLIALAAGAVMQVVSMLRSGAFMLGAKASGESSLLMAKGVMNEAVPVAADYAARSVETVAPEAAQALGGAMPTSAAAPIGYVTQPSIVVWFLLGAAFTILLLVVWYYFVTRKNAKE